MYKEHLIFEKPHNENVKIWRYMDFTKFVSILDKRALFFARADKLPDPFEGSYSKANIEIRPKLYKDIPEFDIFQKSIQDFSKDVRKYVIINSWHMNDCESAAMWRLYLKSDEGVAIQSTFKRLTRSFDNHLADNIYIGKVKYIDYEAEWLPEGNLFYPFLHKRKSFEHEQELRAIILRIPSTQVPSATARQIDLTREIFDLGAYVDVDTETLVENVFVSPTALGWFKDLVKSVMNKYDFRKPVKQSSLAEGPVY